MLDVNNDIQNEVKYKAEDNFWLYIGTKGSTGNPKVLFPNDFFSINFSFISWRTNSLQIWKHSHIMLKHFSNMLKSLKI